MKNVGLHLILAICLISTCILPCRAQIEPIYSKTDCIRLFNVDSYYDSKDYDSSILYIHKLINSSKAFKNDLRLSFKLFRCYKGKNMPDSAYFYLEKALSGGYYPNRDYIIPATIEELTIFNDLRNNVIRKQWQQNERQKPLDSSLIRKITRIGEYDQVVRTSIDHERRNTDSAYSREVSAKMRSADSANTLEIKKIIAEYGWPGYSLIGKEADMSLWAIVQHADKDVAFQVEVLQLIGASFLVHNTHKKHYAYLYDRICVNKGLPQLFGTQVKYSDADTMIFEPMQDSLKVDYYRHGYDMAPLAEYKRQFMQHYYRK